MRRPNSSAIAFVATAALSAAVIQPSSAAQEPSAADAPAAPAPGPTALTVNGRAIDLATYENWLLETRGEMLAGAFGHWIAVQREARARGVTVAPAAVEAAVQADIQTRVENVFQGERAGWVEELASSGRTEAGYVAQQRLEQELQLKSKGLANIDRVVPEAKVLRDWELAYGPRGMRLAVRGLKRSVELVADRAGMTVEERNAVLDSLAAEATAELEGLRARVAAGETLNLLAKQFSDDQATASRGGLFDGPFDPVGWPSAVVDALVALPEGQVSAPLRGRGGVWLFEVVTRRETPLESVRDELHRALVEAGPEGDEINATIGALIERTEVVVGPSLTMREVADREAPSVTVDGIPVSMAEYATWLRLQQGELMARRFAEELLIVDLADAAEMRPTDAEIDVRVAEDRQRIIDLGHSGDERKWIASLEQGGRSEASWIRTARHRAGVTLRAEMLWREQRVVEEQEVRNLWADRYGIDGISVTARYIVKQFELPERDEEESERAYRSRVIQSARPEYDELLELSARVEDGEDFAALAQRFSDDAETAPLGGTPPGGFDLSQWDAAAQGALGGLQPGDLTTPVMIEDRLYLFEVTDFMQTPFDTVRDELRLELETTAPPGVALAAFRNVLTRDLSIEVAPTLFK